MPYETIRLEVAQGVATITLARPDAYNALTLALARELLRRGPRGGRGPGGPLRRPHRGGQGLLRRRRRQGLRAEPVADRRAPEGADDLHPRRRLPAGADAEARDHGRQRRGGRGRARAGDGRRPRDRRRVGAVHHGVLPHRRHAGRLLDLLAAAARRHPPRGRALLHEPRPHREGGRGVGARDAGGRPTRSSPTRCGAWPPSWPRARPSPSGRGKRLLHALDDREPRDPDGAREPVDRARAGTPRTSPRACGPSPRSAPRSSAAARAASTGGGAWPGPAGPASRRAWPRAAAASRRPSGSPPGGPGAAARPAPSSGRAGPSGRTPCRPR